MRLPCRHGVTQQQVSLGFERLSMNSPRDRTHRKLLRTIRLDASDTFVFAHASQPGEWAVPGTFMFWDCDAAALSGRQRQAFRAGFLGLQSFGWSTLAVVSEATDDEREQAIAALAAHLLADHGAPDIAAARAAASEELSYAEELAQQPVQTLIALNRRIAKDGSITEQFRTFAKADARQATAMPCSAGAFAIVDDDGAAEGLDASALAGVVGVADMSGDTIDLAGLVLDVDPGPGTGRGRSGSE